jgi:hypothetical protein
VAKCGERCKLSDLGLPCEIYTCPCQGYSLVAASITFRHWGNRSQSHWLFSNSFLRPNISQTSQTDALVVFRSANKCNIYRIPTLHFVLYKCLQGHQRAMHNGEFGGHWSKKRVMNNVWFNPLRCSVAICTTCFNFHRNSAFTQRSVLIFFLCLSETATVTYICFFK